MKAFQSYKTEFTTNYDTKHRTLILKTLKTNSTLISKTHDENDLLQMHEILFIYTLR